MEKPNLKDLRKPMAFQLEDGLTRIVMIPRGKKAIDEGKESVFMDLRMDPLTSGEYGVIRAYLHSLLSPAAAQIREFTPDLVDLIEPSAADSDLTIEDVYDVMAPKIVNWSYSLSNGVGAPATHKQPYVAMAMLDSGVLLNIALYLLRNSEVCGTKPPNDTAA